MKLYLSIIKLFLVSKILYEKYYTALDVDFLKNNYPEVYKLVKACEELRKNGAKEEYGAGELEAALLTLYPSADIRVYEPIISTIDQEAPDVAAIEGFLRSVKQRMVSSQVAFKALDVAEGRAGFADLVAMAEQLREDDDAVEEAGGEFVSDDLEVLLAEAYSGAGLSWRLGSLNRSLGPLRKGDFGFVFARPETGKTTFLASEVTHFAEQVDGPILWVNNEEGGAKVGIRCYEASLGATLEQIEGHPKRAREAYYSRTGRHIRIKDVPGVSRRDVEQFCRALQPSLIVVDQLDKVGGFDGDREDLRMGAIYGWARELAKKYCPVIGVSQADGSAEGVKYLNMGHVANAKTAKQAEADWIIGIGVNFDDHPHVRGISVCKNKLLGGEQSIATMRHGKWDVIIQPEIGRYIDMEGFK